MKWTPVIAILAIFTLMIVALCKGFDGIALSAAVSVIGGIAGYQIKSQINKWTGGE